jgi:hypothetical protein
MIGEKCKHKDTGHIGIIRNELPSTNNYPEQWGIYWYTNSDGSDQFKRLGYQEYWQDKEKIEIMPL